MPIDYHRLFNRFSQIMKTTDIHPLTEKIAGLDKESRERVYAIWDKAEVAALGKVRVREEGLAMYNRFLERPKALVTMQGMAVVKKIIGKLNLSFEFVATREHSLDRAEQLRVAVARLEERAEDILFVADTDIDSTAALKVGCQFLSI